MTRPGRPRLPIAEHGTCRRYEQGCREECCRRAHRRRLKLATIGISNKHIPGVGTRRRIRALRRIGWRNEDIAAAAGLTLASIKRLLASDRAAGTVVTSTAVAIRKAYDQLSMTPGGHEYAARLAIRQDWPGPLAWDDETIDDPAAQPYRPRLDRRRPDAPPTTAAVERNLVDVVVVERALAGVRVHANPAERTEVLRRWTALGRPLEVLNRTQGWNAARDLKKTAA